MPIAIDNRRKSGVRAKLSRNDPHNAINWYVMELLAIR